MGLSHLPIDVVYTWVNGSDPHLIKDLELYKSYLMNPNQSEPSFVEKLKIFTGRSLLEASNKKVKQEDAKVNPDSPFVDVQGCPMDRCIQAPVVVSKTPFDQSEIDLNHIRTFVSFESALDIKAASPTNLEGKFLFIKFPSVKDAKAAMDKVLTLESKSLSFSLVYYTSEHGNGPFVKTSSTLVNIGKCILPDIDKISGILSFDTTKKVICVDKNSFWNVKKICKTVYPLDTYLVWPPWDKYALSGISFSDVGAHRFADNEELRYSLRSLATYAPWVRNIYIVTNGQIPNWLNVNHPRIHIVTHREIFRNSSHIPSFSSPAIESNLHNIPRISNHFLYLNDDVILGRNVYPDDFITKEGYKIYLAWNIPNCNPGCPPNWLSDGYCDIPCNVTACNYDGGDCLKGGETAKVQAQNIMNQHLGEVGQANYAENYCNIGCSRSWVCDKYCDPACNHKKCGFDGGDCQTHNMKLHLFEVSLWKVSNYSLIDVPKGIHAMYINVSLPEDKVLSSTYETVERSVVRTATLSLPHKVLTLTFYANRTETVEFTFVTEKRVRLICKLNIDSNPSDKPYKKLKPVQDDSNIQDESWEVPEKKVISVTKLNKQTFLRNDDIDINVLDAAAKVYLKQLQAQVDNGILTDEGKKYRLIRFLKLQTHDNDNLPIKEGIAPGRKLLEVIDLVPQRKLLDSFADSLHHVNNLYTLHFGKIQRKVISHMPFLINKTIVNDLQSRCVRNSYASMIIIGNEIYYKIVRIFLLSAF